MTCKRCGTRTLLKTAEQNTGRCNNCTLAIGREFSRNEAFDTYITENDNAWKTVFRIDMQSHECKVCGAQPGYSCRPRCGSTRALI